MSNDLIKCSGSASCKSFTASIPCVENIYQGSDTEISIQLTNPDGTLLDLNNVSEIFIALFDDRDEVTNLFKYPTDSFVTDEIQILQFESTSSIENQGKILLPLTSEMTSNMMMGGLYAEIRLTFNQIDNKPSNIRTIGCLSIGKIKISRIERYLRSQEDN